MYQRRSQNSLKKIANFNLSPCVVPTMNHSTITSQLKSSTNDNLNLNSINEKFLVNNLTKQLIPRINHIRNDFIYCFYITIQNLIHLNTIYILLYHKVFWFDSRESKNETIHYKNDIDNTKYETTSFLIIENKHDSNIRSLINLHLIDKYIYITLSLLSIFELIIRFIWIIQEKLSFTLQKYIKWQFRCRLGFIGMILSIYILFIIWILYHTCLTHRLSYSFFILIIYHFLISTYIDKPNLFCNISKTSSMKMNLSRTYDRNFSSTYLNNSMNRLSFRPLIVSKKTNSLFKTFFFSLISPFRWLSIAEQKFDQHQCSKIYAEIRDEADYQWNMIERRFFIIAYRTYMSFMFFDLIPYIHRDSNLISFESQHFQMLMIIFALCTFLTHVHFLFPIEYQLNLQHLSTHLGQWHRQSSSHSTKLKSEWSYECNFYPKNSLIKISSQYFLAQYPINNAAHPQSISHWLLYYLFHNLKSFSSIQFYLCLFLILCQLSWIISGRFLCEILISCLIFLHNFYTIFQIIRDHVLFNLIKTYLT